MKTSKVLVLVLLCSCLTGTAPGHQISDPAAVTVSGIVFHDRTASGSFETGEDQLLCCILTATTGK